MAKSSTEKEFRFLDGLDHSRVAYNASRRAFVLRSFNASRKRRAEARRSAKSSRETSSEASPNLSDESEDLDTKDLEVVASNTAEFMSPRSSNNAVATAAISLFGLLGQGYVDPFQTLARPTTHLENEMLNTYVTFDYPWHYRARPNAFFPSRDYFFAFNISDPILVDVCVSYGAFCVAERYQNDEYRRTALKYQTRGLQELQRRVSRSTSGVSITTLIAVAGIACSLRETQMAIRTQRHQFMQEDLDLDLPALDAHVTGVGSLIRIFGGWRKLAQDSFETAWLLFWVNCFTSGKVLFGLTCPPSIHVTTSLGSQSIDRPLSEKGQVLDLYAQEMIYMYAKFYHRALLRRHHRLPIGTSGARDRPNLASLFKSGTRINTILREKSYNCVPRIVPLLFINTILVDAESQQEEEGSDLFDMYLRSLKSVVAIEAPSKETLIWALFTNVEKRKFTDLDIIECAARLTFVESRIKPTTIRAILADILCDFISIDPESDVIGQPQWWTPLEFDELLRDSIDLTTIS